MVTDTGKPVSLEQLIALNDEIVAMVRAGVPIEKGLTQLARDRGAHIGSVARALAVRLDRGEELTEAVKAEGSRFPGLYAVLLKAGIRAGRLPAALEAMTSFAWELIDLRRRIASALAYPLMVTLMAYGLFLVFITEVIRRIHDSYVMFHIPVGGALRFLAWLGTTIHVWGWIPPVLLLLIVAWWLLSNQAHVLNFAGLSRPVALVPGMSRIGKSYRYANFANMLAMMIEHHVPLDEGLELAARATGDRRLSGSALELANATRQGLTAKDVTSGFPPFLDWIIRDGQQRGTLARSLRRAAEIYRRRASNQVQWFRLFFPVLASLGIGGTVTVVYALTLFIPFIELLDSLAVGY